jgi:hypothetical protein
MPVKGNGTEGVVASSRSSATPNMTTGWTTTISRVKIAIKSTLSWPDAVATLGSSSKIFFCEF